MDDNEQCDTNDKNNEQVAKSECVEKKNPQDEKPTVEKEENGRQTNAPDCRKSEEGSDTEGINMVKDGNEGWLCILLSFRRCTFCGLNMHVVSALLNHAKSMYNGVILLIVPDVLTCKTSIKYY